MLTIFVTWSVAAVGPVTVVPTILVTWSANAVSVTLHGLYRFDNPVSIVGPVPVWSLPF